MSKLSRLLLLTLVLGIPVIGLAQDNIMKTVRMDSIMYKLSNMSLDDYAAIELPPLDVLYENARKANSVMFFDYESEISMYDVKAARRKPMEWVHLVATYSYGSTDLSAIALMESTYQVWTQNLSSQRNLYWNLGVTVNVPVSDMFNVRSLVRQKKLKQQQSVSQRESELDMIRKEIIELYCVILEKMSTLANASQSMVIAQAQYSFAESEFANNRIDIEALYRSKSFESTARNDYELNKSELNKALLTLEIISCTPIVSNVTITNTDK